MQKRTLLLTFALLFLLSPLLFSAVEASYTAAFPLYLQPYETLHTNLYGGGSMPFPDEMAIYLGRFTINTGNETVRNFRLVSPISSEFQFTGPLGNNPKQVIGFRPKAQLVHNGVLATSITDLWHGASNPIEPRNTPLEGIITIDFYLVSYADADEFEEGGYYTHSQGTFGTFALGYSTSTTDFWSASYDPVVGNDGKPLPPLPILATGTDVADDPVQYEDPKPIACQFSIVEMPGDFPINNAVGSNTALVARAELTMLNLSGATTHQIDLTFTNAEQSSQFALKQTNGNPPHTIPYSLLFGSTPIYAGDTTRWEGLINGTQHKDIFITGIDQQDAETALAGTYQDTIYVHITPVDTI